MVIFILIIIVIIVMMKLSMVRVQARPEAYMPQIVG